MKFHELQTPVESVICPVPEGGSSQPGVSGGVDLGEGGRKETPSTSGLPLNQCMVTLEGGPGDAVGWPDVANQPGTMNYTK